MLISEYLDFFTRFIYYSFGSNFMLFIFALLFTQGAFYIVTRRL